MKVSGNDLFVTAMKKEGVDTIFAYPGGMVVNLLDALHDCHGIDLVLPRHEQGLIHAADGYARATGKVGVCLVTSGPGATNLVTGIATANYDSIPLVCFTGQVPEHLIGNDAFQEVDIIGVTRNIAKFVIMVRDREMLAQRIKEAFYIARSGKPGPVLVDLPTDVMAELGSTSYPTEVNIRGYKPNKGVHVGQLKKAINLLEEAKKPMFLIGGGSPVGRQILEGVAVLGIEHLVLKEVGHTGRALMPLAVQTEFHVHAAVVGGKKGVALLKLGPPVHIDVQAVGQLRVIDFLPDAGVFFAYHGLTPCLSGNRPCPASASGPPPVPAPGWCAPPAGPARRAPR